MGKGKDFSAKMFRVILFCLLPYLFGVVHSIERRDGDDDDHWQRWSTFIQNMIDRFYHQREEGTNQFGFLLLANPEQNNLIISLFPSDQHGDPLIDNTYPLSPNNPTNYINYVAARPDYIPQLQDAIHAEDLILGELTRLWNNYYAQFGYTPSFMMLYSWIMPCEDCVNLILNYFTREPFASVQQRYVVHTTQGYNLPYMTPEGNQESRNRLNNAGIVVITHRCYSLPNSFSVQLQLMSNFTIREKRHLASDDMEQCYASETLQGCLLNCLKDSICCCCDNDASVEMSVDFVNEFMKNCGSLNLESCAKTWVSDAIGNACECQEPLFGKVTQCLSTCRDLPMSSPLNPYNPSSFSGILKQMTDLENFIKISNKCTDLRKKGLLCSNYNPTYFTANYSPCRLGSPCGKHGYSYSWCYTDYSDNWDYCCTDACSYAGENYLWCNSGSTWQYCGGGGMVNVEGRKCIPDYPCGLHLDVKKGTSNFWCYEDFNNNWHYCCNPDYPCGYHDESYKWCYTDYNSKQSSPHWEYCSASNRNRKTELRRKKFSNDTLISKTLTAT